MNKTETANARPPVRFALLLLVSLHSEQTALVFLLFASFEFNTVLVTKRQTEGGMDRKKRESDGRDVVVSLRRFTFVSPGDLAAKRGKRGDDTRGDRKKQ